MKLSEGRTFGYDEHGLLDGTLLFYFHGIPSARGEWNMFGSEALAEKLNLRVICVDRSGVGLSEFLPQGRFSTGPPMC